MYFEPYQGPRVWRLVLLLSFLLAISRQLIADNQQVNPLSVYKIPFSTTLLQWSFDSDSTGPVHDQFLQIRDTAGSNDGPNALYGHDGSTGFFVTQRSTEPSVLLTTPPIDTRHLPGARFSFHLAAPYGDFEHSDFIGIAISLDGGQHFYPQIKVRGSKSGTQAPGWNFDTGIAYSKPFRYAVNSSSIFGHVDPDTKDTVDGISLLTLTGLPESSALVVEIELRSSTEYGESYAVDNLTFSADLLTAPAPGTAQTPAALAAGSVFRFEHSGHYQLPDTLAGAAVLLPYGDTLHWQGTTWLTGPLYLLGGHLDAPGLRIDDTSGGQILGHTSNSGTGVVHPPLVQLALVDTGYHFIGQPSFYPQLDTLPYCWVYDAAAGAWATPSAVYGRPDGGYSNGRVVYLSTDEVPLILEAPASVSAPILLEWADTVWDGSAPLGGWNLVSTPGLGTLDWSRMVASGGLPDSADHTVYLWNPALEGYGSYNPNTGGLHASQWLPKHGAVWVRLAHEKAPSGSPMLNWQGGGNAYKWNTTQAKAGGIPDTTYFEFTTSTTSYQATLLVDSSYSAAYDPMLDQLYMGTPLQPHVAVLKPSGVALSLATFPQSNYYAIRTAGEGTLQTHGIGGFFYLPPDLYPSHQPLRIKGKGPHKVYWISSRHPDAIGATPAELGLPEIESPDESFPEVEGSWDLLGRPGGNGSHVEFRRENGRWIKVIKLP